MVQVQKRLRKFSKNVKSYKTTKKALGKFNLAPEKDTFYRKRDDGELIVGVPPTMYPKLLTKYETIANYS